MSDLLPWNATTLERALADVATRALDVPVAVRDVWNPDTCPPNLLAWLAWAFSVDQWNASWTVEQKRAFIKQSVEIHRQKGTIGAVREAMSALGLDALVQEWFNQVPLGDPYTFKLLLTADQIGIPQLALFALLAVVEQTKNLRSHLTAVELTVQTRAGPRVAVAAGIGTEITVSNYEVRTTVLGETTICF